MKTIRIVLLMLITVLCANNAMAFHIIEKKKDAAEYIGNQREKFTNGTYFYEYFKRSHRDRNNARQSDALIFTAQTNKFKYLKRKDGEIDMILGHEEGREENPVTADNTVWKPIENTLNDDHPYAMVILDDDDQELAIVYYGTKTQVKIKSTDEGLVRIKIKVRNSLSHSGGARRY